MQASIELRKDEVKALCFYGSHNNSFV
jgi:hypothetical protein